MGQKGFTKETAAAAGRSRSERKLKAVRENGRKGGARPRKYPPCQRYAHGYHNFGHVDKCACGFARNKPRGASSSTQGSGK